MNEYSRILIEQYCMEHNSELKQHCRIFWISSLYNINL